MIIDSHAHITDASEETLSRLVRFADRAGVDRVCISSLGRVWEYYPSAARLAEANADVAAACARYPDRLIGLVYLSADHAAESVEHIERYIVHGPCKGIKLWVSQFADDPRLDPIYERAIELDIPILQHTWVKATGNLDHESTCEHVINAVKRHPGLRVWVAHAGGRWEESARFIRDYPGIAMDISGGEPEDGIVECLLRHLPPERVFYGSDAPGRSFVVQMSKVTGASIPDAARRVLLGEGFRRWIGLGS